MKKERVRAWVEKAYNGSYIVKRSDGIRSSYLTYEDAQQHANYINNEDSDHPQYQEIEEAVPQVDEAYKSYWERKDRKAKERKRKQQEREENNRKSKKTDKNYLFVVSCYVRGEQGIVYLQGETDLTKITNKFGGGFLTSVETEAKTFKTKAAAQKFVDTLSKCWMVKHIFKNINVVRKAKELYYSGIIQ